jgi:uracil-DNA glycosylase
MIEQPATVAAPHPALPGQRPADGRRPQTWPNCAHATQACRDCPIGALATQAVPGEGPLAGADVRRRAARRPGGPARPPFVGPAGQLFDRAMAQAGSRARLCTSPTPCGTSSTSCAASAASTRRRRSRKPLACRHWLDEEIALVQPRGWWRSAPRPRARCWAGRSAVLAERGAWLHERRDGRPVFVTLHPSALLRLADGERAEAYARWLEDLACARRLETGRAAATG